MDGQNMYKNNMDGQNMDVNNMDGQNMDGQNMDGQDMDPNQQAAASTRAHCPFPKGHFCSFSLATSQEYLPTSLTLALEQTRLLLCHQMPPVAP